jgi:group I intron endonuclease
MTDGWIYQLVFANGKSYVGQTKSWKRRMRAHKCGSGRDDGHAIKRAIKKYGWSSVQVRILEVVPIEQLDTAEIKWIAEIDTLKPNGYNLTAGGDAQPMKSPEVAAWHKKQIGIAMRKPETRAKKSALWKDPEHRSMMHAARTGSAVWMQTRKDCQNTDACNEKRRNSWARKRAEKISTMNTEEARKYLAKCRTKAMVVARAASRRIAAEFCRDPVAEACAFWEKEMLAFEQSRQHTPASSTANTHT